MTTLLTLDLDGTLVFDRRVSARDRDALQRWRAAGHLLAVNTGKSIFATDSVLRPDGVEFDYCICFTGAVITDGSYEPSLVRYLPRSVVADVAAELEGEPVNVYATTLDNDWVLVENITSQSPILSVFTELDRTHLGEREFVGIPILAVDDELRDELQARLSARWAGVADCHRNQVFLDLVPAGCSKGSGLRDLLTGPLGGRDVEVWSLGDSWNDIEMHQEADHAICLPWSPPEVVAVCEQTVDSVADLVDSLLDGVR